AKNLEFYCLEDEDLPIGIEADETRLRQVLINLLGNAVKFTDKGQIRLRIENRGGTFPPNKMYANTLLRFKVEDTGIGLSQAEISRIFQPFEQAGNLKHKQEGTGLGLTITQRLVEIMGSTLQITSQPNEGSIFQFDLEVPILKQAHNTIKRETKQIIGFEGQPRHILIVDDYAQNRLVLRHLLEPLGFTITEAAGGIEALQLAKEYRPDVILMDLVMPDPDGFETTRQIRQHSLFQDTLIIAISAKAFEEDQKASLTAGCNAFLPKPVEAQALLTLLADQLQLTWIYQLNKANKPSSILNETELSAPPLHELEIIYDYAKLGKMKAIREQADKIEASGEYIPFALKLRGLAEEFEDEQIMNLLEQYLSNH
ncbi:MAG: ATP-binding protein, partial [Chloroflexota bacterium]